MPPRHVYWTILIGNAPTAFRAHDRADLVPTFERLRQTQPDVTMKYFARGRLWDSPEHARSQFEAPPPADRRGRDWRPGGSHRDPRDRFKGKRPKPSGPRDSRDRPRLPESSGGQARSSERRGGWTPKRKPFGAPKSSRMSKPFGARKPFQKRGPSPERPVEPKPPAEARKEERRESRRGDGTRLGKKTRR